MFHVPLYLMLLGAPDDAGTAVREIPWSKSFAEAKEASTKWSKPMMVDFGAEWCGFCKKLDRETFADDRVIRLISERFVPVKVDVDAEPELGKKHKIEGLPTMVFFTPGGEEVLRLEGFRPADMFLKDVEKVIGASEALAKLKEAAEKDPKDAGAQRAYARSLFGGGNKDGAVKVLRVALEAAPDGDEAARAGILLDLGDAQRARGDMKAAREAYEKVLATKAEGAKESRDKAAAPLANALLALGELDGAVKVLDAYLADPSRPPKDQIEALLLRSFAHARRKDPTKALADLKTVRDADPGGRWAPDATRIIDLLEAK